MKTHFYDIESLRNVFTLCNFRPEDNAVDAYYLTDTPELLSSVTFAEDVTRRIHNNNPNFQGTVNLYNLANESACRALTRTFGMSNAYLANNPNSQSDFPSEFRLVCDTDPEYDDDEHPYLLGYNSYNYDTTMLAHLFHLFWEPMQGRPESPKFCRITASEMRDFNDLLFTPKFIDRMANALTVPMSNPYQNPDWRDTRYLIRGNMLRSGRHIDVAKLNEKQQKVALKRLLGQLGYQILESDKLKQGQDVIHTADQFYDLLAYNVSDVVNLQALFLDRYYQSQFELKKGLLDTYPELIYEKRPDAYAPNVSPYFVRRNRLTIDSSSAQFAANSLCPYDHLKDIPCVSFLYPAKQQAEELGIPQVNVLEECKTFFYNLFPQPEIRAKFDHIYRYYKSIEGCNFNDSDAYRNDYANAEVQRRPLNIRDIQKTENCMYYYNADGSPSSCFVNFSIGGIHGAEYNKPLFDADMAAYKQSLADMKCVQAQFPDPLDLRKAKTVTVRGEEMPYKTFLTAKSTLKCAEYRDFTTKAPTLFQKNAKTGAYELNKKYTYTSAEPTNHEDFESYYPTLLRRLRAFWNDGLGYDRYAEIFQNKQKYGKLMKDPSIPEADRTMYANLREGTKLILNSASGAGDVVYDNSIRMNNMIISMRIIGQLFSWRIGQAQTVQGARIISTNTDGLYSVLEEVKNAQILEKESADIHVNITPEPLYLISKDANNRLELDAKTWTIDSASGGTLACRKSPTPTKSLAHPAILDWALSEYIISAANRYRCSMTSPFNEELADSILHAAKDNFSKAELLRMFQHIVASSNGSMNYIFGTAPNSTTPIIMQHYNRIFLVKDGTPGAMHLHAANARVITDATRKKRQRDGLRARINDTVALDVLMANGVTLNDIPSNKEAVIKKVTNIEDTWSVLVMNRSLYALSEQELDQLLDSIDYEKYRILLRNGFENNWRNKTPDGFVEPPFQWA